MSKSKKPAAAVAVMSGKRNIQKAVADELVQRRAEARFKLKDEERVEKQQLSAIQEKKRKLDAWHNKKRR